MKQAFTRLRGGDAACRTCPQRKAESCLQPPNGMTKRRLGHPGFAAAFGEAPLARNREEGKEITNVFAPAFMTSCHRLMRILPSSRVPSRS